jgi:hypothetical protein
VFHNFGKMRFKAYFRLSSWAHVGSFILMGELFFSPKTDMAELAEAFRILREIKTKRDGFEQYSLLVMSKPIT